MGNAGRDGGNPVDVRRTGRIFGWFFIGTFVTSIPARLLFIDGVGASWEHLRFVPGAGSTDSLKFAAILEFLLIVTNIATAVVLYPIARRQSETLSLAYVAARIMESAIIAIGLMSIISVVEVTNTLSGLPGGAHATALIAQGNSLVHTYEWAFLFGPGLVVGFGNGLILGYLMYRSELVPRGMAWFGLIGGPLIILSFVLQLFDVYDNGSTASSLLALPEIVWEVFLGIYCAWKGFRAASPIARDPQVAIA
jgi:Domain of unknown function (DUF4386)